MQLSCEKVCLKPTQWRLDHNSAKICTWQFVVKAFSSQPMEVSLDLTRPPSRKIQWYSGNYKFVLYYSGLPEVLWQLPEPHILQIGISNHHTMLQGLIPTSQNTYNVFGAWSMKKTAISKDVMHTWHPPRFQRRRDRRLASGERPQSTPTYSGRSCEKMVEIYVEMRLDHIELYLKVYNLADNLKQNNFSYLFSCAAKYVAKLL